MEDGGGEDNCEEREEDEPEIKLSSPPSKPKRPAGPLKGSAAPPKRGWDSICESYRSPIEICITEVKPQETRTRPEGAAIVTGWASTLVYFRRTYVWQIFDTMYPYKRNI